MSNLTGPSRRLPTALVVAVALLSPVVVGDEAGAETHWADPARHVSAPAWHPCGDDLPGFDCATFTVPLDYDRPSHGTTELALARFPATDTEHRIGTVFVNPGGPGGSGVSMVLSGFGEFLGAQLDGRFDVVGFDPRGVGASDPLHCFDSEDDLVAYLSELPVFPYQNGPVPPLLPRLCWPGTRVPRRPPAGRRPHEHRGRRPGHGPAPTGGWRQQADLPRVLLRLLPRQHLREPVPRQRAGAGHRRRSRPAAVVERLADRVRPGRDAGRVRRVPAPVRRSRQRVRLLDRRRARHSAGSGWPRPSSRSRSSFPTAPCTPTTS